MTSVTQLLFPLLPYVTADLRNRGVRNRGVVSSQPGVPVPLAIVSVRREKRGRKWVPDEPKTLCLTLG